MGCVTDGQVKSILYVTPAVKADFHSVRSVARVANFNRLLAIAQPPSISIKNAKAS